MTPVSHQPFLVVLGIAQDGGFPQAGCNNDCCKPAWENHELKKHVSCLGIVNPFQSKCWLIDATPDFPAQLHALNTTADETCKLNLDGIFLTHAHSGHYTGLIHLGKESMASDNISVYAMPEMAEFIQTNEPWKFYHEEDYFRLNNLKDGDSVRLAEHLTISPIHVPHRSEFTETVGYHIAGLKASVLYIPDIDSWQAWDSSILDWIRRVDHAFLDGTFFNEDELPDRDLTKITHPFIKDSMELFNGLDERNRQKIHFIHLNHSNPALNPLSDERKIIVDAGYRIAEEQFVFVL